MSLKIVRGKCLPIGVDIGASSVKLAQLRQEGGGLELLAAGAAEIDRAKADRPSRRLALLAQSIRKILRNNPFKGRRCILSLPTEATCVQHVKMAKVPPHDLDNLLMQELEGKLPYPVREAVIRHTVAGDTYGDGENKQEVIAVCSSRAQLNAYLGMARRAKLEVVGVNVASCAIVECFSRLFRRSSDAERTILYIDMGAVSTQVVLAHGAKMVFSRDLAIGADHLDQAASQALQISPRQAHGLRMDLLRGQSAAIGRDELYRSMTEQLDALTHELTKCLRYYESVFRNQGVERIIFVGGGAYDKHMCQLVAQRLNLPAQIGDPLVRVNSAGQKAGAAADRREPHPDWVVAVGLSLGADVAA